MQGEVVLCLCHGFVLFVSECVFNRLIIQINATIAPELYKILACRFRHDMEPLSAFKPFDVMFLEIGVKFTVLEGFSGSVFIYGVHAPFQLKHDVGGLGLLLDTFFRSLLCISYFRPTIVTANFRRCVSIDCWDCLLNRFYFCLLCH